MSFHQHNNLPTHPFSPSSVTRCGRKWLRGTSRMAAARKRDHSGPTLRLSRDLPWVEGGCTSTQSSAQPKKQSLKLWAQNMRINSTQTLPTFGTEATRRGGGQAGPPGALLAMSHPHTSPGCVSTERTGGVWRGRSP